MFQAVFPLRREGARADSPKGYNHLTAAAGGVGTPPPTKNEDLKLNNEELLCRCATNYQMIGVADTTTLHSSRSIPPPHPDKVATGSPFLPPAGEGGIRRSPARRMTEEGEPHRLQTVKSFVHPHGCGHFHVALPPRSPSPVALVGDTLPRWGRDWERALCSVRPVKLKACLTRFPADGAGHLFSLLL